MAHVNPEAYLRGAKTGAQSEAYNDAMGFTLGRQGDLSSAAHKRGMEEVAAKSGERRYLRHQVQGPPMVSQDQFQNAVDGAYETRRAGLTPDVVKQSVSHMSAQAADDYGTFKRETEAHRRKYG